MKSRVILLFLIILFSLLFYSFQGDKNQNYENEDKIISDVDILLKEGNYSEALNILLTELNRNEKSSKISEKAASIFFSQQVYDLALKYYLLAYKNGKTDVETTEKIGECYAYLNKNKKAISYLEKAFYMGNSDPYYLYSLIWVLLKEKKFKQAYRLLEFGYSLYPQLSYFIGAKALYYANTYDIKNARKEYYKVLQLTATYSPIYFYNWGVLEYQIRNFKLAEDLFFQASSFPTFGEAFLALGEIFLGKLDLVNAEKYFLKGKPLLKSPFILYDLIYLYSLKGEKEKIISVYKSIIKFPNKWWVYQYNLNLNEQLLNFYELEVNYYNSLIALEKKSFYITLKDKLRSKLNIFIYSILKGFSILKLKYYASLHLANIDKDKEIINYLQVARKVVKGFPFIEKNLILLEQDHFEKAVLTEGYIYYLYYAQVVKFKKQKEELTDIFLKKADLNYEKLDILNALELKAKINKNNYFKYFDIISKISKIYPEYFMVANLKIPVYLMIEGNKKDMKLIKNYLKVKGIVDDKKSEMKLQINCNQIFTFIVEYQKKTYFFSLTKEDIISDRIPIYSNLLRIFQ